jgi:hypothetical protein
MENTEKKFEIIRKKWKKRGKRYQKYGSKW